MVTCCLARPLKMNEFYLNLPSNTNKALGAHRDNSTSEFRARLPHSIHLTGQWEVALVEMQYPYSWDNLQKDAEDMMSTNEIFISQSPSGVSEQIFVFNGHYDNIDHLIAALKYSIDRKPKSGEGYSSPSDIVFQFNPILRRVDVRLKENMEIILSEQLSYILGFKQRVLNQTKNLASYPPDIRGGIDSLYVYCDLVCPQIVGDNMQPLLRIVPAGGKYGEIIHRIFVAPHYLDVLQKDFSTVAISIKTDRDLPVPFRFGKSVVKLHFRRKLI